MGELIKLFNLKMISTHEDSQKVSLLSFNLHEHLRDATAIFKQQFNDILTINDVF